jgi:hypothetical protein
MTDKTDESGKAVPPSTGPQGKKPSQIIDLKATVVDLPRSGDKPAAGQAAPSSTAPPTSTTPSSKPADASPAKPTAAASGSATMGASAKPAATSTPPPKALPPAPPPSRGIGGFLSHVAAGLVGAVAGVLGLTQLAPTFGIEVGSPVESRLAQRLAALEIAAAKSPGMPSDASQRLTRLEEAARNAAEARAKSAADAKTAEDRLAAAAGAGGEAAQRVAKLEETLANLVAAAGDPRTGRLPQVAEMTTKLRDLETALATRTAQLKTEFTQQLDQRFARTGEQQETARALLAQRTQSLEAGFKALTEDTAALRTSLDSFKASVEAGLRQTAKPNDVAAALAPVAAKVASLETGVQGVLKAEQERTRTAGNILLSLELASLKRALDRGGRYASELSAVKQIAGGRLDLSAFEAAQETGVPNLTTLGAELSGLAHAILDADAQPQDATVGERLLSGFKSVVRVRRTDFPPTDTSAEAIIARTEAALKEGRLADALAEARKLPAKAAVPARAWLKRLEERAAVDKALADLDAGLKRSLAGGATPKSGTTQ